MKVILLAIISAATLLVGCGSFNHSIPKNGMEVRIMNTGAISTTGYKIYDHSFKGLKPGENTEYQLFKKLNIGDEISVFLDTIKISQVTADCNSCKIRTRKKVTIKIKVLPNSNYGQTNRLSADQLEIGVDYE